MIFDDDNERILMNRHLVTLLMKVPNIHTYIQIHTYTHTYAYVYVYIYGEIEKASVAKHLL